MFLGERFLILAKTETSYGVDAQPSPATDAILVSDANFEIIEEFKERKVYTQYYSQNNGLPLTKLAKISFKVELRGSTGATTPPDWACLAKACNATESIGANNVTYRFIETDLVQPSLTIYFYKDLLLHKMVGCRGIVKLSGEVNDVGYLEFSFTGMLSAISQEASFPSPNFTTIKPPLLNGMTVSIGGYSLVMRSFSIDPNIKLVERKDFTASKGIKEVIITDADGKFTCSVEAPDLSTANLFNIFANGTELSDTQLVYPSSTAGQKLTIIIEKLQLTKNPKYENHDGILGMSLEAKMIGGPSGMFSIKIE
jgi:hypothetical protein